MPTRLDRLRALFTMPWVRSAAHATPLWLVAAASGAVIGADLAGSATLVKSLVALGAGLGTNLLASMVYDLVKPDLDDDTRAAQIQQALEARDPASGALIAAALLDAGPDLAQALPPAGRAPLIAALEAGMQETAGPLAQIAPRYAAGLRDEQTDWAALQAALRPVVEQTVMRMEVGHKGQIRDAAMEVDRVGGTVEMEMTAGDEGLLQGARMVRTGDAAFAAATRRCSDCGAAVPLARTTCPRCGLALG
jgi:hypothetical protein